MRFPIRKQQIPWVITAMRALLGPVMIAGAACNWNGMALASLAVSEAIADIYDGRLARRWKCDTPGVRLFDTVADTFFYLCVGIALWLYRPGLWHACAGIIAVLALIEGLRWFLEIVKFGKPASYHSSLARSWGVVIAAAVVAAFATPHGALLIDVSMLVGIACNLEGIAMSLVLPLWTRDVPSFWVAWAIRHQSGNPPWSNEVLRAE
jgi:phosphatidylglycerophosphate synthase